MKIAVIHFGKISRTDETYSDLDENERILLDLNVQAAAEGADLIVNPELSILSLFSFFSRIKISSQDEEVFKNRKFARWFAEERCPKFIDHLYAAVIAPYQKYIVAGIISSVPGYNILHNSAIVLGPGCTKHIYHKRFLTSDAVYAVKGASDLSPIRSAIGNLGVIICSDYSIPLISRSLALNGSDLIVIPAAITSPTVDTLKVRALENGVPFALANCYERGQQYDEEWRPESAIVAANGEVLAYYNNCEDAILWADLNLSASDTQSLKAAKRRGRRPDLYQGVLADLTSRVLRPPTDQPTRPEISVVSVSGEGVAQYSSSDHLNGVIASAFKDDVPVIIVFPEFTLERKDIQEHIRFGMERKVYVVCSFVENDFHVISLFDPSGQEILSYKKVHLPAEENNSIRSGDRLECYKDLPVGRIGILSGEDLLYPEAVEVYRNAGVDLLLVSSRLDFDGTILFEDIAKSRKVNVAAADYLYKGGVYKRYPEALTENRQFINHLRFNIQDGNSGPSSIRLSGLEVVVRTE